MLVAEVVYENAPADEICCLPELGEGELSSPHLALAAETVSADELEPR